MLPPPLSTCPPAGCRHLLPLSLPSLVKVIVNPFPCLLSYRVVTIASSLPYFRPSWCQKQLLLSLLSAGCRRPSPPSFPIFLQVVDIPFSIPPFPPSIPSLRGSTTPSFLPNSPPSFRVSTTHPLLQSFLLQVVDNILLPILQDVDTRSSFPHLSTFSRMSKTPPASPPLAGCRQNPSPSLPPLPPTGCRQPPPPSLHPFPPFAPSPSCQPLPAMQKATVNISLDNIVGWAGGRR